MTEQEQEQADVENAAGEETRDALEAAIAENPEEVADFVDRLGLVSELLDATELVTVAADDRMVADTANTAATLAEAADGLATEETARLSESVGESGDELADALETLVRLQRQGTLDELAQLAEVVPLLSGAMDDEMVTNLAHSGTALGEVADTAADPETAQGLQTMLAAVGEANEESPERVGPVGLVKTVRDPEVQQGLGFLLAMARALGSAE
ncbi:DUF1641 domain-containing protein [Halorussus salinisoli]|uniref:DUF1641 domain-containing protein n=1 Tax=Halorussus salinisoli TaxID=2558242 RepID=UPI0010C1F250|nr:DUF1641 domain-containing protein [Halorussus salinisoli]